ncbi:MAG: hypothetical protein WBQ09_06285 [Terriglobales bacterium]
MSSPREAGFRKQQGIRVLMMVMLALATSWAQSNGGQSPSGNGTQNPPAQTVPAAAQAPVPEPEPATTENYPASGLDQPPLGPLVPSRSFLILGAHASESLDSNVGNNIEGSGLAGVTRGMGSVMLQKMGSHSLTAFDYVGGVIYYPSQDPSVAQIHQFDGEQKFMWRSGQVTFRDQFSYLPQGSFGFGAYGESGSSMLGLGSIGFQGGALGTGLGGIFTLGDFGSLGQQSRIDNLAIVDLEQSLSKRSAITLAGGYGIIHFTNDDAGFFNSHQITAQVGYDYQVTRKTQIALVYGFQEFQYPNIPNSTFTTHIATFLYSRRISGRMDLTLGAGPQVTIINNSPLFGGSTQTITASATASLRYRFPRTSLALSYNRYNTGGSGYFLGATSDIVRFDISRPLTRVWTGTADVGYSHNDQLQAGAVAPAIPSTTTSFQYLYAGAVAQRPLGHHFDFFLSFQFDQQLFNSTICAGALCNVSSQQYIGTIGLNWHSRPIRLD